MHRTGRSSRKLARRRRNRSTDFDSRIPVVRDRQQWVVMRQYSAGRFTGILLPSRGVVHDRPAIWQPTPAVPCPLPHFANANLRCGLKIWGGNQAPMKIQHV
jgi:hypothetical protein